MRAGPRITIHRGEILDTGIGREAGYATDVILVEVVEAERAALPESVRRVLDEMDAKVAETIVFGTS